MKKHPSFLVAGSILNRVMKDPLAKSCPATIVCYQNGREHGYSISDVVAGFHFSISFASSRNSDQIVIYAGEQEDKGVSEDAYDNRIYFSYKDLDLATELILGYLKVIYGDFKVLPKLVNHKLHFVRQIVEVRLSHGVGQCPVK